MTCQVSLAQGTTEVAQGTPFQISVPQGETDRQSSTIITGDGVEIQNPTGHIVCSNVTSTG